MQVLIVDDHPIVAEYLQAAAGRAIPDAVVRIAMDLQSAFEQMKERPADIVLLDLGLPGCGGIESLLRFRKAFPGTRVVVISGEEERALIRAALAAGAAGFIPKTSGPKVMLNALRLVAEGGRYIPPEVLETVDDGERRAARTSSEARRDASLTVRQREVLDRLLEGRTIAQIARELRIADATAKHHALALYAAFGVSSRADLILAASRRMSAAG